MSRTFSQVLGLMTVVATLAACGQQQANLPTQSLRTVEPVQAQSSPLPSPAPPTDSPLGTYRKIASFTSMNSLQSEVIQREFIDQKTPHRIEDLHFYIHIIASRTQLEALPDRFVIDQLQANLDHEVIVLAEWGMNSTNGIRMDVDIVRVLPSQVEMTVTAGATDPSLPSAAAYASAYTAIAIPRSSLDVSKPITFNLINNGQVVTTTVWQQP